MEDSLDHAPLRPVVYISEKVQEQVAREWAREPTMLDGLADPHEDVLREGVVEQGRLLRAAEIIVDEAAERFGGEDPALPRVRDLIDRTVGRLEDARKGPESYTGPLDAEEPDDELVDNVRALVEDRRP